MKKLVSSFFTLILFAQFTLASAHYSDLHNCLKKDSFTLSSAYFDGYYTNKQLVNFNMDCLRASHRALEWLENQEWFDKLNLSQKWLIRFSSWFFLFFVNQQAYIALHESGHALRYKAFGLDYSFYKDIESNGDVEKNIFSYYFKRMTFQCGRGGACGSEGLGGKYEGKTIPFSDYYDYRIIISAGGLNNEMLLSESIGYDMFARNNVDSISWAIYLKERISGASYDDIAANKDDDVSYDPTGIITAFNAKGREDFKKGTIKTAGTMSTFLSATTYSILIGKPIVFFGFRVPDVYPYITTRGMSYKVVSGYEVNEDTRLLFGFESVFGREAATEYSIGIDMQLPISYKCIATFGLGWDLEASVTIPLSSYFSVGIGCEYYHFSSLQGQRHITGNILNIDETSININKNSTSINIFGFISYRY